MDVCLEQSRLHLRHGHITICYRLAVYASQAALREGAAIETGRPVESILVGSDGSVRGVRLASGEEARH